MEGNDIAFTVHTHVACMFEGLLMTPISDTEEKKKFSLFRRDKEEELSQDEYVGRTIRKWRPNELPLKSVIHMTTKLGIGVEVYTFMDPIFRSPIEHWLARKGAHVQVYTYDSIEDLRDDFKYNRDVHTMFTTDQEHAAILGIRSTVVRPDGTFGV